MNQIQPNKPIVWIGPESPNPGVIQTVYFALRFQAPVAPAAPVAPVAPERAELWVSAHSRYKLYVNGVFVTFGPCKPDPWHRYCEGVDVARYLRPGENLIVLKVVAFPPRENENGPHAGPQWSYNRACGPCMILMGEAVYGGVSIPLATGIADWRCRKSDELTPQQDTVAPWLGYTEDTDGTQAPDPADAAEAEGWAQAPRKFSAATDPYGVPPVFPLYQRPIPLLYLEPKTLAHSPRDTWIAPNRRQQFLLDAGELTTGFPRLRLRGGGATLTLRYAEAFALAGEGPPVKHRRDDRNGVLFGHADRYRTRAGAQVYEPFHFRTFRYLELIVETGGEPVCVESLDYLETGYPLPPGTELFGPNEPWVEAVYDLSLRTLRRCMHETYEDCPYYEQLQYTMDTRLQILFTYALCGEVRLAQQALYAYHASRLPNGMLQSRSPTGHPQVIPVFSLHWIWMLLDSYQQTGDRESLRPFLGTADQVLHYFRAHKQEGLAAQLGYWETVDWAAAWSDNNGVPHACQHGPSTIQNFQYAYALQVAAKLFSLYGFGDLAAAYRAEAEDIKQILTDRCFNGKLFREGPGFEEYSVHAQLWAVLCETGGQDFRRQLLRAALADPTLIPCSFPTLFYLFRAFESVGLYEETEPLWQPFKALLNLGLTTVPEQSFGNPRSDCHGWGALMLYEFPRMFLGVRPGEPGWASVVVQPQGFYVPKAQGKVYVPGGFIHVSRAVQGGTLTVSVTPSCPQKVTLVLPEGTREVLKKDEAACFVVGVPGEGMS
jgi:hypothetical protein